MITEKDLQEAIAECNGKRNPNREDCMMLAAFYIIQDKLYPSQPETQNYSYAGPEISSIQETDPDEMELYGDSEFLHEVEGKNPQDVWDILDELMETLHLINPRLYDGVLRKLRNI